MAVKNQIAHLASSSKAMRAEFRTEIDRRVPAKDDNAANAAEQLAEEIEDKVKRGKRPG